MVDFCRVGKISLFTSIMSKLLHSKLVFSSGNYMCVVMLDHNVFCITQKRNSHMFS